MSDNLSPLREIKFLDNITFSKNPSFTNKASVSESEVAFNLTVSYNFLKQLNEAVDKYSLSFVTILNSQIEFVQFHDNDRINARFLNLSYKVLQQYRTVKGRQRQNLLSKKKIITIFKSELVNVQKQQIDLTHVSEEKIELERKCRELYTLLEGEQKLGQIISEQNLDIHTLQEKNVYLHDYIKKLAAKIPTIPRSHDVDSTNRKTRYRSLKTFKSEVEKVLWFADTFGITLKSMTVTSKEGNKHYLNFQEKEDCGYDSMTCEEKDKIKKLVFLMDRFCISDAAYHELTVSNEALPRSYLLVQCKNDLNKLFDIERLPGNVPGAMINLRSEVETLLKRHVKKHPDNNNVKVKISGDGAKVSRISNFVIFSISDVSIDESISYQEQQTCAIVECSENYENIKRCCSPIFDQLNDIIKQHNWLVGESNINVDFFVSSDMKFIQLLLGLASSTSEYACPWCKVDKKGRSDITFDWDYYHKPDLSRKTLEMSEYSKKHAYGCKHAPLLDLPIDHFIPDELHLMLRVTDVLLRNLIDDAKEMDADCKVKKLPQNNLETLTKLIRECGVTFSVWNSKAGDLEWTSLSGLEKVKLLSHLPCKILAHDGVIFENTKSAVSDLWNDFHLLYKYINNTTDGGPVVFERTKYWLKCFLEIGHFRKGYNAHNVTPYMHCLVYHIPYFASRYGPLKLFSGQSVEKNNDIVKQIHQKKSNKWDSAVTALTVRKRLEHGWANNLDRDKRQYAKKSEWWQDGLKVSRSMKRKAIMNEIAEADKNKNSVTLENMSESELRLLLKKHGVNSRVRNREKLLSLVVALDLD